MAVLGSVSFKVNTETLVSQANVCSSIIGEIIKNYNELTEIIDSTNQYWRGEAGDLHRKLYEDEKDNISDVLKRLNEHPKDLLAISGNYVSGETANVEKANSLSGDILS
ncbi:hypothetical protein CIY_34150 [Butyrivibrio fibrisolvens 16/4]|nr:hypothetical protein CIY_34150 [Butyrivibrio fibrisolvens 16/4]